MDTLCIVTKRSSPAISAPPSKAALSERTREFLTADAETIGLPELRPDRTVQIDRIGDAFSKVYYIEKATHRIDASGYRTRFHVRETTL